MRTIIICACQWWGGGGGGGGAGPSGRCILGVPRPPLALLAYTAVSLLHKSPNGSSFVVQALFLVENDRKPPGL